MVESGVEQRLAAILAADVAGYSKLMGRDERSTIATLRESREVFQARIEANQGRVVDMAGDSVLAVFNSATGAVLAATEAQGELAGRNEILPEDHRMYFRVGVNLGDIRQAGDGTIYGDAVNIAARLEGLAEPGGVMISEFAYTQVRRNPELSVADAGSHAVKNIGEPVHAYRVVFPDTAKAENKSDLIIELPHGPSIAVLPFTNMSGDPAEEYFCDGVSEDLITKLTMFPNYMVIARNTTFQYKGKAVDVIQVGRELGTRFVLEGSVRRSENRVRVTAQLIDANTGGHVWAEKFDRDLSAANIFDIQDDITEQVAATIGDSYGVISLSGYQKSKTRPPENLSAYEFVLGAHGYYAANFTPQEHARIRDGLEAAVKADENYADAWAWLAAMYRDEYVYDWNVRPDPLGRAEAAALRALDAEPNNQEAHLVLAHIHFFRHDLESFFTEANRTLSINPNSVDALGSIGTYVGFAGEWDRGLALIEKGMKLNPKYPPWFNLLFAFDYFRKSDYEHAAARTRAGIIPGAYWTYPILAAACGKLGRVSEGQKAIAEIVKLVPGFDRPAAIEFVTRWNLGESLSADICDGLEKAGIADSTA